MKKLLPDFHLSELVLIFVLIVSPIHLEDELLLKGIGGGLEYMNCLATLKGCLSVSLTTNSCCCLHELYPIPSLLAMP